MLYVYVRGFYYRAAVARYRPTRSGDARIRNVHTGCGRMYATTTTTTMTTTTNSTCVYYFLKQHGRVYAVGNDAAAEVIETTRGNFTRSRLI